MLHETILCFIYVGQFKHLVIQHVSSFCRFVKEQSKDASYKANENVWIQNNGGKLVLTSKSCNNEKNSYDAKLSSGTP